MTEFIGLSHDYFVPQILAGLAIVLIVIDYWFPTDIPCQFGYFLFAVAFFLWVPLSVGLSLVVALLVWGGLALLHHLVLYRYLANAVSPAEDRAKEGA